MCEKSWFADLIFQFHDWKMDRSYDVYPKAGRILLFQHRDLLHSGDDVLRGVKYTMRTDLMYKLENPKGGKAKVERRRQPWNDISSLISKSAA